MEVVKGRSSDVDGAQPVISYEAPSECGCSSRWDLVLAIAGTAWLAVTGAAGQDVLSYVVVLLLASVPVALPAAFALAGALGAQHLAGLGILTTRLSTLQDAAGMDVLCVDKTGTITANRLTVTQVAATPPATEIDVLRLAAGACDEATQDPIDLAILHAAAERDLPPPVRSQSRAAPR